MMILSFPKCQLYFASHDECTHTHIPSTDTIPSSSHPLPAEVSVRVCALWLATFSAQDGRLRSLFSHENLWKLSCISMHFFAWLLSTEPSCAPAKGLFCLGAHDFLMPASSLRACVTPKIGQNLAISQKRQYKASNNNKSSPTSAQSSAPKARNCKQLRRYKAWYIMLFSA